MGTLTNSLATQELKKSPTLTSLTQVLRLTASSLQHRVTVVGHRERLLWMHSEFSAEDTPSYLERRQY